MKKMYVFNMVMILLCLSVGLLFTGCSDDNDDNSGSNSAKIQFNGVDEPVKDIDGDWDTYSDELRLTLYIRNGMSEFLVLSYLGFNPDKVKVGDDISTMSSYLSLYTSEKVYGQPNTKVGKIIVKSFDASKKTISIEYQSVVLKRMPTPDANDITVTGNATFTYNVTD